MPDDRFLDPCFGHSEKVCALTDFQFRVWITYLVKADDFGIMRASAVSLQDANDYLASCSASEVQAALEAVITCGLVQVFEHQNRRYVFQHDWQKYQKVRYPRASTSPKPPRHLWRRITAETQKLFAFVRQDSRKVPEEVPPTRAGTREEATANGKRLSAVATGNGNGSADRFDAFWAAYPRKEAKKAAEKIWARLKPTPELLAQMLETLETQKNSAQWQRDGGQYIPHPSTWLNAGRWTDEGVQALPGLSDTMRHNLAASEEAGRLIDAAEEARRGRR